MKYRVIILLLFFATEIFAQKTFLFETREYKKAYESNTRSRDGKPGDNYWQNSSDYVINAEFNPSEHLISGNVKITYHNESPDSLQKIVIKLMQNMYRKGASRQMAIPEENIHDGVKLSNIKYNGTEIAKVNFNSTVVQIALPETLSSKSSGVLEMDFQTPIAKSAGLRSGTIDPTSFFVAYWFPQVAVYDDIFGWDTDEYVGVPETYNDFCKFDVSITVPSEFVVWSTGEQQNIADTFSDEITSRINLSKKSKVPVKILTEEDIKIANGQKMTWHFTAENVPDFAWGTSDHYIWEGMAAQNPGPASLCWVQTAYAKSAPNFDWVLEVAKNSVEIFSKKFPGVPYPYFKHISFSGTHGGGMEFPMLANNYAVRDSTGTIMVTAHELAHNYYPFMMGINERKYGWWDETMTTLMESYLSKSSYPRFKVTGFFNRRMSFPYIAPTHEIQPLMTETSSMMKVEPTIVNFYVKGPAVMDILANLIGTDKFYAYNRDFMNLWVGKHPTPYDLYYFINQKEGDNLNWFWDACFFAKSYPDIAIEKAEQNENYLTVRLKNEGGMPCPFELTVSFKDGSEFDETYNVAVWKENLEYYEARIPIENPVEKVTLNKNYLYDTDPGNNEIVLD